MNILEKISEEIGKKKADYYKSDEQGREHIRMVDMVEVKEIIRSHMNNLQDAGVEEKSILCTIGEDGVLTSYDVIIHCSNKEDQDQTIKLIKSFNWIPVSERLPEKAGTYIVSAKDGKREIVTFVKWQNRFKKWDLSGARAYWKINAWKPLPDAYKGE